LWCDEAGSPAVEFALIAPVFLLILTATFDIGSIIHKKFSLDAQVSSAASYSQNLGAQIVDGGAADFASAVATLAANGKTSVDTKIILNNAMSATFVAGGMTTTDSSGIISQCYCPARVNEAIQWGAPKTCRAACTDGTVAGRFIEIHASTPYISLFGGLGIAEGSKISVSSVIRIE
jgi:hypothetical protein